jgi:hypothetical protein
MVTRWCSLATMARCCMRAVCDVLSLGQKFGGFSRYGPLLDLGGSCGGVGGVAVDGIRAPPTAK